MRILQLCPRVPWPANDGGRVAMLQITRSLARAGATVDVLALNPRKHHSNPAEARAAMLPATLNVCDIDTSDAAAAAWRSVTKRLPLLVARFYSPRFAQMIRDAIRTTAYDIVHVEGQFLLPYVPVIRAATTAPVVLRAQNVEFRAWEGVGEGAVLQRLVRSLKAWEIAHLDDCDAIVAISREDGDAFAKLGGTRRIVVAPCGIDIADAPSATASHPPRFYFIGSMLYRPNQKAARWLADELWPQVRSARPDARLTIAGSAFPADLRSGIERAGIEVVSDFSDVRTFSAPFGVMLAPLFSGSGMRIKVLEAMALGKAIVATPLGVGGIDVTNGSDVLLASDASSFAGHVIECMNNPELVKRLGLAARKLVETEYSADRIGAHLLESYRTLLSERN